jgi:hypothetical protein
MAERKPGFAYFHSEMLEEDLALSNKTGTLYCQGGVKYTAAELEILNEAAGKLPLSVHLIKKVFKESEVIEYAENRTNTGGAESKDGSGKNENIAGSSVDKVEGVIGNGARNEDFALEIY